MSENRKGKGKENMGVTLGLWLVLCSGAMAVMLLFAVNKTIAIADISQEQGGIASGADRTSFYGEGGELSLQRSSGGEKVFHIPLPRGVRAENVVMENRYTNRELRLYIQCQDTDFYKENGISGDVTAIREGSYEIQEDGVLLKLQMDRILEYRSTMEGDTMVIAYSEAEELYRWIVVLDPAGGGEDTGFAGESLTEKDVVLRVARQALRELTSADVKVYLTRTEDTDMSEQERLAFLEAVGADLYIGIGTAWDDENADSYGILSYYNEQYFIPDFGNVQLADLVTRLVTVAASNRAVGLIPAEEGGLLKELKIPAIQLSVGYLSNGKEETLLGQEAYQEKLAKGIAAAILQACETLSQLEEGRE